jgi:hypothetical protein
MNVYLVKIDGLCRTGSASVVAENAGEAYDMLMADLKERMLAQSGKRLEEIKEALAAGPVDLRVPGVYLLDNVD